MHCSNLDTWNSISLIKYWYIWFNILLSICRSGSISRGFRGDFKHFQIIPSSCEMSPIMANQFSVILFILNLLSFFRIGWMHCLNILIITTENVYSTLLEIRQYGWWTWFQNILCFPSRIKQHLNGSWINTLKLNLSIIDILWLCFTFNDDELINFVFTFYIDSLNI